MRSFDRGSCGGEERESFFTGRTRSTVALVLVLLGSCSPFRSLDPKR